MNTSEILVSVDVGCHSHSVAIGLSGGRILDEFEITHNQEGFSRFFAHIQKQEAKYDYPVSVAMEGYNGYARPLDQMVRARDYRLFNINNMKLARFKEVFPGAAKTDAIDARKGLELFQLRDCLPMAKDVLTEVMASPVVNDQLKRVSRRRRRLVSERARVVNAIQADLQAVCPGLAEITGDVSQVWFMNFLLCTKKNLNELSRKRYLTLKSIKGVGVAMADRIVRWQKTAVFSEEVALVSPMILEDAERIVELRGIIQELDAQLAALSAVSDEAGIIRSVPGFGPTCSAEIAGEIGSVERFAKESSLALYLGMAPLDNSSGTYRGSKVPRQVNRRAKMAMMTAVDRHRKCIPESQRYYERKRAAGKTHNQAIRALGRHLCRVIFKMLKTGQSYEIR